MEWEKFKRSLAQKDLIGLDSEFTLSTRRLVSLFKADGAHLNKWWVMTSVEWICPCCSRKKSEIVRLNKNNFLSCQLHEHHDHMKDVVKSLFEELSIKKNIIVADELSERFAIKTAFSLSAYDNTVICSDCNKADAGAKRLVKCHKFFSFSPKEISEFISVSPNREHQINSEAAKKVWARAEPVFEIRMELAKQFATIAAEKRDWYQPSEKTAKQTEISAARFFRINGLLEFDEFWPERLLYNTEPFKGAANSWRKKKNPVAHRQPSPNEIYHLSSTRGKFWNRYDEQWTCPCCQRIKYHCVRASKKNPWILEIKRIPLFHSDTSVSKQKDIAMCADCVDSAINLGREVLNTAALDAMFPSSVITLEELSRVIIPRPHSKHAFQNDLIDKMLPSIVDRYKKINNT
ncbi:hypothetical protein [Xenorhabdus bovienii]|uniref:hypothetical protein n=1 Tax=Xenorhabdus bovienii TaxID=40576 RepID=UPI0023B2CAD9|nr:hypothetical protein [Xenorhabdus bovienii]MDE9535869.1 hypothetical protein [Xenorhabdus bovienii]MDE9588762.1 hypothetical protein [Xenorhabdus bovienii]